MSAVGVKHLAFHQAITHRLLNNCVKNVLGNRCVIKASPSILAERRGIKNAIGQFQSQEPAIGDIDPSLMHQLALRANTKQIANEQRFEHQSRIKRRATIVGTIKPSHTIMNKRKVDHRLNLTKQMILGDQLLKPNHLKSCVSIRRGPRRGLGRGFPVPGCEFI